MSSKVIFKASLSVWHIAKALFLFLNLTIKTQNKAFVDLGLYSYISPITKSRIAYSHWCVCVPFSVFSSGNADQFYFLPSQGILRKNRFRQREVILEQ